MPAPVHARRLLLLRRVGPALQAGRPEEDRTVVTLDRGGDRGRRDRGTAGAGRVEELVQGKRGGERRDPVTAGVGDIGRALVLLHLAQVQGDLRVRGVE